MPPCNLACKIRNKIILPLIFVLPVLPAFCTPAREGVYHRVKEGETLWGISRTYGAGIEKIRHANRELSGADAIRPGQEIFIPGSLSIPVVEPLTGQVQEILRQGGSGRWECIVIHHSATSAGSARLFDLHHRHAGGFRSMGPHFVVADGTDNTLDGEIETGFRRERQWDGAHTQGSMNYVGIGICIVGNFENSAPTTNQMKSLSCWPRILLINTTYRLKT